MPRRCRRRRCRSTTHWGACSLPSSKRCGRNRRPTCRRWTVTRCAHADVARAPVRLRVIGEVAAGRPFTATVGAGEAARIFTGGVMPAGADAIVVQEITEREGDTVAVLKPASKGRHIRPQGLDFRRGDILLRQRAPVDGARSRAARRR